MMPDPMKRVGEMENSGLHQVFRRLLTLDAQALHKQSRAQGGRVLSGGVIYGVAL